MCVVLVFFSLSLFFFFFFPLFSFVFFGVVFFGLAQSFFGAHVKCPLKVLYKVLTYGDKEGDTQVGNQLEALHHVIADQTAAELHHGLDMGV